MFAGLSSYSIEDEQAMINPMGERKWAIVMMLALGVFLLCYLLIVTEKINRALVACLGGLLMVALGIVNIDTMVGDYIDWKTIGLLISMMVIVSITSRSGLFEYIAIFFAQKVRGQPLFLLMVITALTAFGSALLDNVTTVFLLVPIVLTLTEMLEVRAVPYLISIILFSNIGGAATLIGDPPNIMIGQEVDHLGFNDFLLHLTPAIIIIYLAVLLCIVFYYRKSLHVSRQNVQKLLALRPALYLRQGPLLIKSVSVLCFTVIGFLFQPLHHIDVAAIAAAGALLLLLWTYGEQHLRDLFQSIEWKTLFFFAGLFMLVGGLRATGWIHYIAENILSYTNGDMLATSFFILWGSGLISGMVDNIPFVAVMIPVIQQFQESGMANVDPLWWSLALGACLGGNATLIGASANVIVAGMATKNHQPLRFFQFLKIGFPVVLLSLIISTLYLYFRYWIHFD